MRPVWLVWRRSGNGTPAVYHAFRDCVLRPNRKRKDRLPRQMTENAARKVARMCRTCASRLALTDG